MLSSLKNSEKYIDVSVNLFNAVKSFGFERGRINVVLNYKGDSADKQKDLNFAMGHRNTGEDFVEQALTKIEKLNLPGIKEQISDLKETRAAVKENRLKAESELQKSFAERDGKFPAVWFEDISEYINKLAMVAVRFNSLVSDMGLQGKSYINILENATLLRDNAGPVCSYTAAAILSPEKFNERQKHDIMMRYSKTQEDFYRIKLAVENVNDSRISEMVKKLEDQDFKELQKVLDSTLKTLNTGGTFEYTQSDVTKRAVVALTSIKDIVDVSGEKLREHIREKKSERYNVIFAYIIMFFLTAIILINFIKQLKNKIYIPTKDVIAKLRKLSDGDTDIEIVQPKYNDEIADLMKAVNSFREALIQISESKDILEKKVEERTRELAGKAQEIEMILDNIPILIFFKDTENNIIRANKAALNALGIQQDKFEQTSLEKLFPGDCLRYFEEDQQIIRNKQPILNINEKFITDYIGERDVNTSKIPLFNSEGEVENILVVITDITDLTKAQIENRRSYQLLAQQSKMAEIGSMVGVISHQLKQPLNIISLLAENLDYDDADYEYIRKNIVDTVMFMGSTIDSFLTFFRPSLHTESFYFSSVVSEVLGLVEKQLEKEGVRFEVINEVHFVLTGFKNEIKQIVLNIISNSRDVFNERKISDRKIWIKYEKTDDAVCVSICDNGGGIPDDLLPDRIFELYSSTKGSDGNGIGMFICKNIMTEHMNGDIQAFNSEEGACFKITFREFKEKI